MIKATCIKGTGTFTVIPFESEKKWELFQLKKSNP